MQVNGKVTVTLEGVATVLRVLQEKLSVMPEGAASALKQIHGQVHKHFDAEVTAAQHMCPRLD